MLFVGFYLQKGKVIFAPLLEMSKGNKIVLGMTEAVSNLRRITLKTVGEVPGEAGNSSGAELPNVLFHRCRWSCSTCMGNMDKFLKVISAAEFVY